MVTKSKRVSRTKQKTARASVSFPVELYSELERIARQKKVSVAWVVREATEKYLAEQYPLFVGLGDGHS
jgi:metal-responsive CopG/Arc/MetJ family transcriptional regulator